MRLEKYTSKPELKPWLLSQSNIPKPLHGVNPRSIMGQDKWDVVRRNAYAKTNYHCAACGVHKSQAMFHAWLEAHEDYIIDHESAKVTVRGIEPLCHACHNFIHSGFLLVQFRNGQKSKSQVFMILENGFSVLSSAGLPAFVGLKNIIGESGYKDKWRGKWLHPKPSSKDWSEWRMVWDWGEYGPKFRDMNHWQRNYQ